MDAGELVPDEIAVAMVAPRFDEPDATNGFLLDGFPRTTAQADQLDQILRDRNENIDRVLLIEVPDDVLIERMIARDRTDDTGNQPPIELYRAETIPLLDHYVNQLSTIDQVHQRAITALA